MWRWVLAIGAVLWLGLGIHLAARPAAAQEQQEVLVLTVEGPITPAMGAYLERGLEEAERAAADLLVLRLDTPGGNVGVMQGLVKQLSNATVPTLVYVWPSGGQAASAGTFIALSADLVAMARQTTIGAASVVGGAGEEIGETLSGKITNDLVAAIQSQTERRSPEAQQWAERAITEAIAANATQALDIGVADFVARDLDDLLAQVNGTSVELASGESVTLNVADAPVRELRMSTQESLLHVITDPNIALLLISLGGLALVYELAAPGGYVGGIFGFIATVLGFYSLGSLNADWTGLALMAFAFVLFIVEIKAATHGIFAAGGIAAFVFGALLLFQTSYSAASLWLVFGLALVLAAYSIFSLAAVMRTRHQPAITGRESLIGSIGEVRTPTERGGAEGMVLVAGELWKARAPVPLPKGSHVRVVGVRGLQLDVVPESTPADTLVLAEP